MCIRDSLLCPGGIQIFYGDETNRPMVAGVPNDGNGGAGHSLRSCLLYTSRKSKQLLRISNLEF